MQSGALSKKAFGAIVSIAMVVGLQIPGIAFAGGGDSELTAQSLAGGAGAVAKLQALTTQDAGSMSLTAWDGATATAWTKGSGTQEDPYLIESAENLVYLRDQVNSGQAANSANLGMYSGVYFEQTADIDLSEVTWTPIGVYASGANARAFSGHYDGGGHTVSKLKVDQACATGSSSTVGTGAGLFAYVKGGASARASITNLVVEGSVKQTASGNFYVAGIVGYAAYTDIKNCGNEAAVTNAGQPTAGITGNCYYSTVDGCFNHGNIVSTYQYGSQAAGIAGQAPNNASFNTSITDCYNIGDVSSSYYAGGIVGQLYGGSTTSEHTVENCYNTGAVSSTATTGSNAGIAGGIVGYITSGSDKYASAQTMTNCYSLVNKAPAALIGGNQNAYMTITNSGERTDENMRSAAFVSELGSKFIAGKLYPVLYWEAPAGIPVITAHPESAAYVKGTPATALSVTAESDAANGDLRYQWYKATAEDLTDAQAITGATSATYTPATDELGDSYFYCVVNNDVKTLDGSGPYLVQSSTAHVQVWSGAQAVAPTITTQPQSIPSIGQTESTGNDLSAAASFAGSDENDDNCALSYQWQSADSENGAYADVEGATSATFAAPTDKVGTKYYRCVVTNTREKQSQASAISDVVSVKVVGLEISTLEQLKSFAAAVDEGQTFENCTVTVTNDVTVTGIWNPIGEGAVNQLNWKPFSGEFDGGKHSITFKSENDEVGYYALFGCTGSNASIHDLVIKGDVKTSGTTAAGLVAQVTGDTSITRVGNEASVVSGQATAASSTAGLVGMVSGGNLTVVNSYNKGVIEGSKNRIAGLVANVAGTSSKCEIASSYNAGTVTSTGSSSVSNIAGICGYYLMNNFILRNCYNTGAVSIPNMTSSTNSGALCGATTVKNPTGDDACYYLDDSNPRGRAGTSAQPAGFISKTADDFKNESADSETGVLALLNNATYAGTWKAGSALDPAQASPILAWEAPESEPTKFTIAFVDEDNTELLAGKEYAEGTKADDVEKPSNPTKTANPDDGYTYAFDKWVDSATGAADVADVTADATYKATYTKTAKEYSITYDLDGGTEADPANPTAYTVEIEDFALTAPSREGHSFAGWTGTGIAEASKEVTVPKGSTGNRAYKATWSKNAYDVTFDSDGGSAVDKQTVEHGSTAAKPADPAKDGFDFVEWQKDGAAFDFATEITGETQLKAVWKEKQKEQTSGESGTNPSGSNEGKSETTPGSDSGNSSAGAAQSATPAQSDTAPAQSAAAAPANNGAAAAKASTVAPSLKAAQVTNTSVKLAWGKVAGAAKYVLYGNKCSTKNQLKKIATVKGTSYKVVKAAGKKLKKGAYYKFQVRAYDAKGKLLAKTLLTHVVTTGGKYCNIKKVTTKAKNNKISLKVGKSFKLGAKQVRESKKLKFNQHVGLRYATSDKAVATVSKTGAVTAKKAGTCYVYATAQNGVFAKVKVTVK